MDFALILLVYEIAQSSFLVGVLMVFFYLPSFLFSLIAGVYTDVFDRRQVMRITKILWGILVFLLAFPHVHSTLGWIILISIVIQVVDEFFIPAERASLPNLVGSEMLLLANSVLSTTMYLSVVLGYGLAGFLVRFLGSSCPFILAAVLSLLSAGVLGLISPSKSFGGEALRVEHMYNEDFSFSKLFSRLSHGIFEGINLLIQQRFLLLVALSIAVFQVTSSCLMAVLPGYMEEGLRIYAQDASFVFALPLGVGLLGGAYLAGSLGRKENHASVIGYGVTIVATALVTLSFFPRLCGFLGVPNCANLLPFERKILVSSIAILLAGLTGLGASLAYVPLNTVFQNKVADHLRGRSQALVSTITQGLSVFPVLFVGALADIIGVVWVLLLLGLVAFGLRLFVVGWVEKAKQLG